MVVNSFVVTPLVVVSSSLTAVVVNEASVDSRDVCNDLLSVVPLADISVVDFIRFGDVAGIGVDTDVFVVEIADNVTAVVVLIPSILSSLLQRLDRRQRMVT